MKFFPSIICPLLAFSLLVFLGNLALAQTPPADSAPNSAAASPNAIAPPPNAVIHDPSLQPEANNPTPNPAANSALQLPEGLQNMDKMMEPAMGILNNLNALKTNPLGQKLMQIAMDKEIQDTVGQMRAKPNLKNLLLYQIIFLIAMFLVKTWNIPAWKKCNF